MSVQELDDKLRSFYAEVRNKQGDEYSRNTLLGIRSGIERYLNSPPHNKGVQISGNSLFKKSNMMLEAKLKNLKQQGKQSVQHKPKVKHINQPVLSILSFDECVVPHHIVLVPSWSRGAKKSQKREFSVPR